MNSWLLILTAAVILLILLSRINLYIDLHFCRRENDDYLRITLYSLQELFIYSIKIPTIMLVQHDNLPWLTSEVGTQDGATKTKVGREHRFLRKTVNLLLHNPDRFFRLFKLTKQIFRRYRSYMDRLSQGLHCEKLEFKIIYGFEDAACTGIFMGAVGSVVQLLLTTMHNRITLDTKPTIRIQPNYDHRQLELELSCIFRIRLGNVITATIAVLRNSMHTEATGSG